MCCVFGLFPCFSLLHSFWFSALEIGVELSMEDLLAFGSFFWFFVRSFDSTLVRGFGVACI